MTKGRLLGIGFWLLLFMSCFLLSFAAGDEIGSMAKERAAEVGKVAKPIEVEQVIGAEHTVKKLAGFLVVLLGILFILGAKLIKFDPFKRISANKGHAVISLIFGAVFLGFVVYEMMFHVSKANIFSNAASEHGKQVDGIFQVTIWITMIAFFLVQAALFVFVYLFRGRGQKASYYHDNDTLEKAWTIIPSVVIAGLIFYGVSVWENIFHTGIPEDKLLNIEIVGEQFQWRLRYPGADNKLGKHAFKLISSDNPLGVDSTDKHLADDRIPQVKELHLPVGKPVKLNIRSKDVLHGVYLPHFRINMYATPGQPSYFEFTPIKTTEQMRKEIGNPKFNYEMACAQLCGISHYNMRVVVVVEDDASYKKWLASQPSAIPDPNEKNLAQKNEN